MAYAIAGSMPLAAAASYVWPSAPLSERRADDVSADFIDFEFSLGGSVTMLPADELFADGKLLPLRPHVVPVAAAAEAGREQRKSMPVGTPETMKILRAPAAVEPFDPYVFSPKAPTCSIRWRELLRLRKAQSPQKPVAASPSPSPVPATPSRASSSSAARSLKLLLLQRSGGRASDLSAAPQPLLRESSDSEASLSLASSRFSLSSSSSSSGHEHDDLPRHSLDSVDLTPKPRIRLVRSSQPQRRPAPSRAAAPPPPPSADSPRMNSSGKIVFQGLERSSSSPAGGAGHSSLRSRSRVMDRSYSTPVVLNVPVCSRPSFGFFKDRKEPPAKDAAAAARLRSSLGRKTTNGGTSVSCRDLGTSKRQLT